MRLRNSLCSMFLAFWAVSLAIAQKVTTDYDHAANFSNYHTYAWTEGTRVKDNLMDQRIRDDVDNQLTAKGLQKVADPEQADLLVAYDAAIGQQAQRNTMGIGGWGYGWGPAGGMTTTTVDYIPVGALSVKLGDNKTHRVVWRGTGSGTVKDKPEKIAEHMQKSVAKMFKEYPPKG